METQNLVTYFNNKIGNNCFCCLELGSEGLKTSEEGSIDTSLPLKNRSSEGDKDKFRSARSLLEPKESVKLNSLSSSLSSSSSSSLLSFSQVAPSCSLLWVSLSPPSALSSSSGTPNSKSKKPRRFACLFFKKKKNPKGYFSNLSSPKQRSFDFTIHFDGNN
jgi:hypothetical protein